MKITEAKIKMIDSATWKIKVLKVVLKFLNWCTIPKSERKKDELVINLKFEIE